MAGRAHFRDLIHPEDLDRVREATRSALQHREEVEVEYRLRTRSGEEKWVLSRGRGVYAADGALDTFEGLAIDVTAQKNAESGRFLYERKLLDGQKLESLGLLAGGIAHDFNNLLSTILGNASLARGSLSASPGAGAQLRAIETAARRAADLCRQMLAYAGQGRFVIEPTNLTALVEGLVPLLRVSVAQQASLQLLLDPRLPPVRADATQLRQIVMNLVLNAVDAIAVKNQSEGGNIFLTTGVMAADPARLAGGVAGADLPGGRLCFSRSARYGCGHAPRRAEEDLRSVFHDEIFRAWLGPGRGARDRARPPRGFECGKHPGRRHPVSSVPATGRGGSPDPGLGGALGRRVEGRLDPHRSRALNR
ncbi:MAG: PAS domain S-box protein [Opitutus sp.]|nr:PAS domain S-box protein [Opitutus sp.]